MARTPFSSLFTLGQVAPRKSPFASLFDEPEDDSSFGEPQRRIDSTPVSESVSPADKWLEDYYRRFETITNTPSELTPPKPKRTATATTTPKPTTTSTKAKAKAPDDVSMTMEEALGIQDTPEDRKYLASLREPPAKEKDKPKTEPPASQPAKSLSSRVYDWLTTPAPTAPLGGAPGKDKIAQPVDEPAFQQWYAGMAKSQGLDPNPDDPKHFYDYRAAFRAGATPDKDGHWPSEFKRAGHPNLIVDGKDTRTGQPVKGNKTPPLPSSGFMPPRSYERGGAPGASQDVPTTDKLRAMDAEFAASGAYGTPASKALPLPPTIPTIEKPSVVRKLPDVGGPDYRGSMVSGAEAEESIPRRVADIGLGLAKGTIGLVDGAVALVDLTNAVKAKAYGYKPEEVPRVKDLLKQHLGYSGRQVDEWLASNFSPETLAELGEIERAREKGVGATTKTIAKNPFLAVLSATESVPGMLAGGATGRVVGKVAGAAPLVAAAAGEGTIAGVQNLAQFYDEQGRLPNAREATLLGASALTTGMVNRVFGGLAAKYGYADIDSLLAGARKNPGVKTAVTSVLKELGKVPLSIASEAAEEAAQTVPEVAATNLAAGKPWSEGMGTQTVESAIVGGVMGLGGAGVEGVMDQRERAAQRPRENFVREVFGAGTPDPTLQELGAKRQEFQARRQSATNPEDVKFLDARIAGVDRMITEKGMNPPTAEDKAQGLAISKYAGQSADQIAQTIESLEADKAHFVARGFGDPDAYDKQIATAQLALAAHPDRPAEPGPPPASPEAEAPPAGEPPPPPPPGGAAPAGVGMFVTKDQRQQLYDLGYTSADVNGLTGDAALAILAAGTTPTRPAAAPAAEPVTGFTTAQGSTYTVAGNQTTRLKTRTGEQYGPSDRTIYLDPETASRAQAHIESFNEKDGKTTARPQILADGTLAIVVKDRDTGKVRSDLSKKITATADAPAVGLHPFEVWKKDDKGDRRWHFGNAITSVGAAPAAAPGTAPAVEAPPAEPPAAAPAAPAAPAFDPAAVAAALPDNDDGLRTHPLGSALIALGDMRNIDGLIPTVNFAPHEQEAINNAGVPLQTGRTADGTTFKGFDEQALWRIRTAYQERRAQQRTAPPASRPAEPLVNPAATPAPTPDVEAAAPAAEGATPASTVDDYSDEDITAALADALGPKGPRWRAGSQYDVPDNEAADVVTATVAEQISRRVGIAQLADRIKAAKPGTPAHEKATKALAELQAEYDGVWLELDQHMEGIDVPVLDKQVERDAKAAHAEARAAREEAKAEKAEEKKEEEPAKEPAKEEARGDAITDEEFAAALREEMEPEEKPEVAAKADEPATEKEPATKPATEQEQQQAAIDAERAALDKEEADLVKEIKERLNRISANAPLDPETLLAVAKLTRVYVRRGILKFREAALRFRGQFGDNPKAEAYFEFAWPAAQEMAKGATLKEAFATVRAMKSRPTVAAALAEEEEAAEDAEAPEPLIEQQTFAVGDYVIYRSESGEVTAVDADGQVHITVDKVVAPGKDGKARKPKRVDLVLAPGALVHDPLTAAQHARLEELQLKDDNVEALTDAEYDEIAELESTLKHAMDISEERGRRPEPDFLPPTQDYTLGEDRLPPAAVFPPPAQTATLPNIDHEKQWDKRKAEGYFITQEEANARLAEWKAEAKRLGREEDNSRKVIYSLFDRTGNWSQPFVDAGYIVRRYDIANGDDLMRFFPTADIIADKAAGLEIVGVLAAPPCPTFTLSATRWWKTKHDQDNQEHLEKLFGYDASRYFTRPVDYATTLVDITKAFVEFAAPTRFHVLENPIGRLHTSIGAMPQPTLVFHPAHFGDPQTKKTHLWGAFNPDLPTAPVYPTEGSKTATLRGDDPVEKLERSATSEHFSYAFFMGNRFDSQEAATAEPASEPAPVISFRSGNQTAPADIAGFIKAGQDVGVTALGMIGSVRAPLVEHVKAGGSAFIDSGAFGKTELDETGRGRSKINFDAVFSLYEKLAEETERPEGLYVVAPDVAPLMRKNQAPQSFPEETKAVQDKYADKINDLLASGMHVIVPVQVGPTMAARGVEVVEQFDGAMIGLPGNQAAISDAQLDAMLTAMTEAGVEPAGFHFLGLGEKNKRLQHLVTLVRSRFPDTAITSDATRAPAMFVEGRPAQNELKDRIIENAAADVDEAWESDSTELAGEFFRGNFDAFDRAEIERLAEALNTTPSVVLRRQGAPRDANAVRELVEKSGLEDALFEAFWYVARDRGTKRTSVTTGARTTVIAETDHPERTFQYGAPAIFNGQPAVVGRFIPDHPSGPSYQIESTLATGRKVHVTVRATDLEPAPKATSQPATSRPAAAAEDTEGQRAFKAVFTQTKDEKVGGGPKTTSADRLTWAGELAGEQVVIRTMPRPIVEGESFLTNGGERLRDSQLGKGGYFLDVEIREGDTPEVRAALLPLMQAADERPVRLRGKGEKFRTGSPGVPVDLPATSRPTPVEHAPYWMNEAEIDQALGRFRDHPILGPAARFLDAFKDQVNRVSDGWAYWRPASHAAGKLQALLNAHLSAGMGAYPHIAPATVEDVRATLPPIKSFMTKRGTKAGMKLPQLDLPTATKGATNVQTPAQSVEEGGAAPQAEQEKGQVARPTYPDGRLIPRVGDEVYQRVPGFGGSPAVIAGEVFAGRGGELRVRMTRAASLLGGGSSSVGKTQKLNEHWTVAHDPEIVRRREAREQAEKDKQEQDAREEAESQAARRQLAQAAIAAGAEPLTRDTPVGWMATNHFTGETYAVEEQSEYGPIVDGRTLGNPDDDGTWGGYSVVPGVPVAEPAQADEAPAVPPSPRPLAKAPKPLPAGTTVLGPIGNAPIPAKWTRSATDAERAVIFQPGNVVPSYIGTDTVIAYTPTTDGALWSVKVRNNEDKDADIRIHATEPRVVKDEYRDQVKPEWVNTYTAPPIAPPASRPAVSLPTDAKRFDAAARGVPYPKMSDAELQELLEIGVGDERAHAAAEIDARKMAPLIEAAREDLRRTGTARNVADRVTVKLLRDSPDADYRVEVTRSGSRDLLPGHYAKEGNAINAATARLFGDDAWDAWWAVNKPNPAEAPAATKSWKAEITDGSGWTSNALRFATQEAAQASGQRTFDRWMAARDLRVVESDDPVTHYFADGENVPIGTTPTPAAPPVEAPAAPDYSEISEAELREFVKDGGEAAAIATKELARRAAQPKTIIRLTDPQQGALEVAGLELEEGDDMAAIKAAWDGKGTLTVTAATGEAVISDLIELSNREGEQAEEQKDQFARRAAKSLDVVADKVRAATRVSPAAPELTAMSDERAALEAERAKLKAEGDDLVKQIKAKLGRVGSNTPLDPEILGLVVKLTRTYVKRGIVEFRDAAMQFREAFGDDPTAEEYFELAWPTFQAMVKGQKLPAAIATARAQTNRPTVAAAVAAYTEQGGTADGTDSTLAAGQESAAGPDGRGSGRPAEADSAPGVGADRPAGAQPGPGTGNRPGGAVPSADPGGREPSLTPRLYQITDADEIGTGTVKQRVARNLAAIQIIKEIEAEDRLPTPDEQAALVKYVGWGGLSRIFEPWKNVEEEEKDGTDVGYWANQLRVLEGLLTPEEFARARNSTQNAHYTSPTVVRAMWDAVRRLGVRSGSVLEPSAGIGHFVGLTPADLRGALTWALVEKDPMTARIAKALYPAAYTQATGLEEAQLPEGHFTLAIGNVPFGAIPITDALFKGPAFIKQRIHNYFFAKSLDRVAPGGLVAYITSHGTMDAKSDTSRRVREHLAAKADLLGAIRLPFTAFKGNAGTSVVTDIIFLRVRHKDAAPAHAAPWIETVDQQLKNKDGEEFPHAVNEYFLAHPEMVLGTHTATGKMRRKNAYNVEPAPGDFGAQLAAAIEHLPADAINLTPPSTTLEAFQQTQPPVGSQPFEYLIHEGKLAQIIDGRVTPVADVTKADEARIRGMLPIRAALRSVYDLMAADASNEEVEAAQAELTAAYDAFVGKRDAKGVLRKKHGYISEPANFEAFREDPDLPLLLSLEDYDSERETAEKTAIFTTRTMRAERAARVADSPSHALQLTLGERGRIDMERIAELTGSTPELVSAQLEAQGEIIFTPSGWQLPSIFLSGNVRVKLRETEAAAQLDDRYQAAADRLRAIIPADIPSHQINTRLGAPWVPVNQVQAFVASIVGGNASGWTVTYSRTEAKWNIEGGPRLHTSRFTTPDVDTKTLLLAALNDRRITVRREDSEGIKRVDPKATALARQRREDIHKAFAEWLFNGTPERRAWAVRSYNDRFNAHVEPSVDGSYLQFPGMANIWRAKISPHQRNAVARVLQYGNTLLAHVVGAGKTLEMIGAGMEMRRLGLARKPLYVVPNHLIAQWPSEFLQYYPKAKILVMRPEDLDEENRKRFTARMASGDWDAVLMPYSSFVRISMSAEAEGAYHKEMLDEIETAILEAWAAEAAEGRGGGRGGRGRTPPSIKQLENARDKIQAKLDKLANRPKDDLLTFEQLGVDALMVDEAHSFKNLYFHTRQQAAGIPQDNDAQRAMDLYLKVRYINTLTNHRNVVMATGTPVSNSMAEVFVMQKFLQEHVLEQAGIERFDAWLATFGHITVETELDPSGTGMSARARLSAFRNLPELASMFRQMADVKMIDDLPDLKTARPKMLDDAIQVIQVPSTSHQLEYLGELKNRAENLDPRDRRTDNMAKITVDGRMSALDMRLIDRRFPDDPDSKVNKVVDQVADIWSETKHLKGTQLVFMDSGTPGAVERAAQPRKYVDANGDKQTRPPTEAERHRGMDLYADITAKLVKAGIPRAQIASIHDIDKVPKKQRDAARKALFRKVQDGTIRVLIGSSGKMGTGMNVQDRLVALHNVDPTYKPSETEQRNGRILRRGNKLALADKDFRIRIYNYVTTGVGTKFGFDAYMWQLNEAKAKIIADFFKGKVSQRDVKLDLEQTVLTSSEMKAIGTGNPLVMEMAKIQGEVDRLRLVYEGWEEARREAAWSKDSLEAEIVQREAQAVTQRATAEAVTPYEEGTALKATIDGVEVEGHKAIGEAIFEATKKATNATEPGDVRWGSYTDPKQIGTFRGLNMYLEASGGASGPPVVTLRHPDDKPSQYGWGSTATSRQFASTAQDLIFVNFKGLFAKSTEAQRDAAPREWVNPVTLTRKLGNWADQLGHDDIILAGKKARLAEFEEILKTEFSEQAEFDAAVARLDEVHRALGIGQEQEQEANGQGEEEEDDEKETRTQPGRGGGDADYSIGDYAETSAAPATGDDPATQPRGVEIPEMVGLARQLQRSPRVKKSLRKLGARGQFTEEGIVLKADLFDPKNVGQLAKTLAHEIGHLVDYLPDRLLTRGNLLGHLRTLTGFLKGTYTAADGTTIKNADVRAELIALSAKWRPWPATSDAKYKTYRNSAKELYADAISVLLNEPALLQKDAPVFYKEFMAELGKKPAAKKSFDEVWALMAGSREELLERRAAGIQAGFEEANRRRVAKQQQKKEDAKVAGNWTAHFDGVVRALVDKHQPFIKRLAADRAAGKTIAPEDDPFLALSERSYRLAGQAKAFMQVSVEPVFRALKKNGLTWDQFGMYLMLERITAGDRTKFANPGGHNFASAEEQLAHLLKPLTPEQQAVLREGADVFREGVKNVARAGHAAGLYTDEAMEAIEANPAYATFVTVDHSTDEVSSRLHKQIGTTDDIANVADSTVMKTLVTIAAIEHNKTKTTAITYLKSRGEAPDAEFVRVADGKRIFREPSRASKLTLLKYMVDGKLEAVEIDPYISRSIETNPDWHTNIHIRFMSKWSNYLKSVLTTYNVGFQTSNLRRDFKRFWKAMNGLNRRDALTMYWGARHLAVVRAYGLASPEASLARQAYRKVMGRPTTSPTATEEQAWNDLLEAERAGIISTSFNDHLEGDLEADLISNLIMAAGVGPTQATKLPPVLKQWADAFKAIEEVSNFVETLPKAAAMYEFKGEGEIADIPADQRQFIRTAVGSPDFLAGGTWKPVSNVVLMFSNAIAQSTRADYAIATDPVTRQGYWWKTFQTNVLPKIFYMAAIMAAAGAAGDDDDDDKDAIPPLRWVRQAKTKTKQMLAQVPGLAAAGRTLLKVPEYDLTNYSVLPVWVDSQGNAVYLRIPNDDTGKWIGGLAWKFLGATTGDHELWRTMTGTVGYIGGQIPSESPYWTATTSAYDYLKGENPKDPFRQRDLYTQDEQRARAAEPWVGPSIWDPFPPAMKKFIGWELQQLGAGSVIKFYPGDERPTQKTTGQTLIDLPAVSGIVGRYLKISKYGESERNRAAGEAVESRRSYERQNEQRAVNKRVSEYWKLPADQQTKGERDREARTIAREMYPELRGKEREEREDRIKEKFALAARRGEADALAGPVMSAGSKEAKVEIIIKAQPNYSRTEFEEWLRAAEKKKIISHEVLLGVKKRQRELAVH